MSDGARWMFSIFAYAFVMTIIAFGVGLYFARKERNEKR